MKRLNAFIFLLLTVITGQAQAHKSSDSYLTIQFSGQDRLNVRWDIALRDLDVLLDLDINQDRKVSWGELASHRQEIEDLVSSNLLIRRQGRPCGPAQYAPLAVERHDDGQYVALQFSRACQASGAWDLSYRLMDGVDTGHRAILSLPGSPDSASTLVLVPGAAWRPMSSLTTGSSTLRDFWIAGVSHIWSGYDHILFLLSLLLPVSLVRTQQKWLPVGRWLDAARDAAAIVTAFTLAHSLTLGLAALGWITLSSRWVEAVIALSVVLAALHNLHPVFNRWRWRLAFAFGLVHGLGFAGGLANLTSGASIPLMALAGFNLGVETGQLALVCLFLPLAMMGRSSPGYQVWVLRGGSVAIASVACIWFCQRLLNISLIPG